MKPREFAILFILAAIWGASFMFISITVSVLHPLPLVTLRVLIAGIVLLLYAYWTGITVRRYQPYPRRYLIVGIFNNAIPFTLISAAEVNLTSSIVAMLNATTPLFGAILAALFLRDKITPLKGIGIALGLVGVGIIIGWRPTPLDRIGYISALAVLGASFSYAAASIYIKINMKGVPAYSIAVGQLLGAGMVLLPITLVASPAPEPITPLVAFSLLALALVSTAFAYQLYFYLIAVAGPTQAVSVTFLVPIFSSIWGAIFLSEGLSIGQVVGFVIILIGLMGITGIRFAARPLPQPATP